MILLRCQNAQKWQLQNTKFCQDVPVSILFFFILFSYFLIFLFPSSLGADRTKDDDVDAAVRGLLKTMSEYIGNFD